MKIREFRPINALGCHYGFVATKRIVNFVIFHFQPAFILLEFMLDILDLGYIQQQIQ